MNSKTQGWECWETLSIGFCNFNLGDAKSFEEAHRLVADGKKRWAAKGGGVLALVDPDWVPGDFEFLLDVVPSVGV